MSDVKIALVHLDRRTAEVLPLDEKIRREAIGGAALNLALMAQFGADCLLFGTGPLTGTLAPASALAVASFVPAATGTPGGRTAGSGTAAAIAHVPLLLTAGPDLRCSGIDHLVIAGLADRPTLLHIDGGRIRFLDPPAAATDLLSLEASLRRCAPPCRTAILTSPAAEASAAFAAVSLGRRGSLDRVGLAGAMAARKVTGILLGGTGGVAFAPADPARSLELAGKIKKLRKRAGGFEALLKALGSGEGLQSLKGAKLQEAACFHCPAPCMVHARFAAPDPHQPQGPKKPTGLLLMDHRGFAALARKRPAAALPLMAEAIRLGLSPCAAASLLPAAGGGESLASDLALLTDLGQGGAPIPSSPTPAAPAPAGAVSGRSPSALSLLPGDQARRLAALALVLGLCPIFLQRFPEVEGDLAAFLPADLSWASIAQAAAGMDARE